MSRPWSTIDDTALLAELRMRAADGLGIDDAACARAIGRSPSGVARARRRLQGTERTAREPHPDLSALLRKYTALRMSAAEIAVAIGPDAEGRTYAARSIQQICHDRGIALTPRTTPIPTVTQLVAELKRADFVLLGRGRWQSACKTQMVVVPPGATPTRVLARMVRRAIRHVSDEELPR